MAYSKARPLATLAELRDIVTTEGSPILTLLKNQSYSEARWENDTNRFGPAVHLVLRSELVNREVDLGLFVGEVRPVASTSIFRLPDKGLKDSLSLKLFSKEHVPQIDQAQFDIDPAKPLREEAARVFKLHAEVLAGPALPIVTGEEWEEGHFYDWTLHA